MNCTGPDWTPECGNLRSSNMLVAPWLCVSSRGAPLRCRTVVPHFCRAAYGSVSYSTYRCTMYYFQLSGSLWRDTALRHILTMRSDQSSSDMWTNQSSSDMWTIRLVSGSAAPA
eukprot:8701110-Pyramimonas_sp.AAC.1